MGKGGSAANDNLPTERLPAPKEARSGLANTLPQPTDEITKRSLRESIPAHCFKRSYTHSLGVTAWDLAMVATAFWAVHAACAALPVAAHPFAWLAYWWYQGLTFTGLWVIAHECGHGGFTNSRLVNDAVGFVLHSALLSPYFSWAITHAKHHHYTNHMTMGETWVPSTAHPSKRSVKEAKSVFGTIKRIGIIATFGWYAYLLFNATGAKQNLGQSHFNPAAKALFKKKDANYVRASNIGMMISLAAMAIGGYTYGAVALIRSYLIPQMICNFCARHAAPSARHALP